MWGDFLFSILKSSDGDRMLPFFGRNWLVETDTALLMSISNTSLHFFYHLLNKGQNLRWGERWSPLVPKVLKDTLRKVHGLQKTLIFFFASFQWEVSE